MSSMRTATFDRSFSPRLARLAVWRAWGKRPIDGAVANRHQRAAALPRIAAHAEAEIVVSKDAALDQDLYVLLDIQRRLGVYLPVSPAVEKAVAEGLAAAGVNLCRAGLLDSKQVYG